MWRYLSHLILRLLLVVLIITDIRLWYKAKKENNLLHRELSKGQKYERVFMYAFCVVGLIVPFEWYFLLVTIGAIAYFFYYTDREIYLTNRSLLLRGQYYEYKLMKNISYENNMLQFDYKKEHVKLSRPLLSNELIENEIVAKVSKYEERRAQKRH